MVQATGGGGGDAMADFHGTLGPAVYQSIVSNHIHLFMTTVNHRLMSSSIRIMHHVAKMFSIKPIAMISLA